MKGGIPRNLQPEDVVEYRLTKYDYKDLTAKVKNLRWDYYQDLGSNIRSFCRIS